jgi:hypothetical protein
MRPMTTPRTRNTIPDLTDKVANHPAHQKAAEEAKQKQEQLE